MKIIAVVICLMTISCTSKISTELFPGMRYRDNPVVQIIEYNDKAKLQKDCVEIDGSWWLSYKGCAIIPYYPSETCIIRVMEGDEESKKHELAHCSGYRDM